MALTLADEGRIRLLRMVGSTIASWYRRIARHVGPMRGSVTTPRSGAF